MRDPVVPAERESRVLIKRESSPLVAMRAETAPQGIQPDVGTPLECNSIFPVECKSIPLVAVKTETAHEDIQSVIDTSVERESHGPSGRETRTEAPSQDIQPVFDTPVEPESSIPIEPEASVHIERESTPLVAVKLEPNCQDSQPIVSSASTPAPSTQGLVIVRTSPTCKEWTDINWYHARATLLRCH